MNKTNLKFFKGLREWLLLNALLLVCMIAVRPLFFLELYFRVGIEPIHFFTILSGSIFDLLLVCRIFTYGLIPFFLLFMLAERRAARKGKPCHLHRSVFIFFILLYAVVSALLAEYYCNLTTPLDHVILVYSLTDLKTTVSSSASLSLAQVFWFLLQIAIPVLLVLLFVRYEKRHAESSKGRWLTASLTVVIVLAAILVPYNKLIREERMYPAHHDFCYAVNQPSYSFIKIMDYLRNEVLFGGGYDRDLYDEEILQAVKDYQHVHPEFLYDTPGYPFYRKTKEQDVLGPFFKTTSDSLPPNLVFIVVEGLGRRLTGVRNPMLSFTPFVDSLSAEGLFWPQCLSTAERTFGVLPSIFASAPHGRYGFSTTLAPTPRHHSLLRDLEHNGYYSSFYYGGDMAFDHYDFFMKSNHVDYLFSPAFIVDDSSHYQLLKENHRWGLDDDQLFKGAILQKQNDTLAQRPFADIFLTLSTHEPFVVDHLEAYEERVRCIVENTPEVSETERNNVLKNLNIFACYLYVDDCIRELFAYYASRSDFENTVFIITGDHRMAPLPFGSSIRKYNVPLVVYSPLLLRTKVMNAVVSHLDITPTINAYLHENYSYTIEDHCHWLGTALDTVAEFRNTRKLMFMLNNRDVVDYYSGNYMISVNNLLLLDSTFAETIIENDETFRRLKKELNDFDRVSRFVVQKDYLVPRDRSTQLYSCHFDFARNSSVIFDKYLVKDSAFLLVGRDVENFSLCSNIAVMPIYEDLTVELSFDIRNVDTSMVMPALVVSMGQNYFQQNLSKVPGLNTGKWEHYHCRVPMNAFVETETKALKIFLWNKKRGEFELDNLVINVETSLQKEDQ